MVARNDLEASARSKSNRIEKAIMFFFVFFLWEKSHILSFCNISMKMSMTFSMNIFWIILDSFWMMYQHNQIHQVISPSELCRLLEDVETTLRQVHLLRDLWNSCVKKTKHRAKGYKTIADPTWSPAGSWKCKAAWITRRHNKRLREKRSLLSAVVKNTSELQNTSSSELKPRNTNKLVTSRWKTF